LLKRNPARKRPTIQAAHLSQAAFGLIKFFKVAPIS